MVTQLTEKSYSVEEYFALEKEAESRHEFINGEILEMAGGTTNHNEIITNLCLLLKPTLRQQGRKIYTENVRLWLPEFNLFTYPDVMVMPGEPIYYSENKTTVTNPLVIIEVLSAATRAYDQGEKFGFYRSIETLQEYILIEPERFLVMVYRKKTKKNWLLDILETETNRLDLKSINLDIPLGEIYEGILISD